MKKIKSKSLILLTMILLLVITGCGKEKTPTDNTKNTNNQENNSSENITKKTKNNVISIKLGETIGINEPDSNDSNRISILHTGFRNDYLKDMYYLNKKEFYLDSYSASGILDNIYDEMKTQGYGQCILDEDINNCVKKIVDWKNEGVDPKSDEYIKEYPKYRAFLRIESLANYYMYTNKTVESEYDFISKLVTYYFNNAGNSDYYRYVTLLPLTVNDMFIGFSIRYDMVEKDKKNEYEKVKEEFEELVTKYPKTYMGEYDYKEYKATDGITLNKHLTVDSVFSDLLVYDNDSYSSINYYADTYCVIDYIIRGQPKVYDFYEYIKKVGIENIANKELSIRNDEVTTIK